jgi:hypothetical protein
MLFIDRSSESADQQSWDDAELMPLNAVERQTHSRTTHMDPFTLTANDIKAVLHAIEDVTMHHGHSLQPKEQTFLVNMDNRLRGRTEATLRTKQVSWLTALLAQAPKRTARAKTRAKSNGSVRPSFKVEAGPT